MKWMVLQRDYCKQNNNLTSQPLLNAIRFEQARTNTLSLEIIKNFNFIYLVLCKKKKKDDENVYYEESGSG